MNIVTRYSLGAVAWHLRVWNGRKRIACPLCSGTGRVQIGETDRSTYCPDCTSRGYVYEDDATLFAEITKSTIGQVRAEVEENRSEVSYMAFETGVGSGSVLRERDLYPTYRDAEQACADRGAVLRISSDEVAR